LDVCRLLEHCTEDSLAGGHLLASAHALPREDRGG